MMGFTSAQSSALCSHLPCRTSSRSTFLAPHLSQFQSLSLSSWTLQKLKLTYLKNKLLHAFIALASSLLPHSLKNTPDVFTPSLPTMAFLTCQWYGQFPSHPDDGLELY